MNEYYGVPSTPNSSFLQHYGVKGMKWGIRKAVERAYSRPRSPGFNRVREKLEAIQQKKIQKQIDEVQKAQTYGKTRKVRKMYEKASEHMEELNRRANRNYMRGQVDQNKESASNTFWWGEGYTKNKFARALNAADRFQDKRSLTNKGHAKAVRKRNAYADQMAKMFKGTAYGSQTKRAAKKKVRYQF